MTDMKKILLTFVALLMFSASTFAQYEIDEEGNLLIIKNIDNKSFLYFKPPGDKEFLVHIEKTVYPVSYNFWVSANSRTDIYDINWADMDQKTDNNEFVAYTIVINAKTKQVTPVYENLVIYSAIHKVGFFYDQATNTGTVKPLFQSCKKPITFQLEIAKNSILGIYTDFKKNGNLRIDYAEPIHGNDATKIIKIDYKKLYKDCGD